ncbi:MAG: PDZ domain-containing protein [Saprospirales bacterium]|nr:MAG: PDZ domain-containing protein [Saprospirales bacterium]
MNLKNIYLSVAVIGLSLFFLSSQIFSGSGSSSTKEEVLLRSIVTHIDRLHFEPREFNEEFSTLVFNEFLNGLDANKRFLTQNEIEQLRSFENRIHLEIRNTTFEFFELADELMSKSAKRAYKIFEEVIQMDFDLNAEGYFELDADKIEFAANKIELKERWQRYIHFQLVDDVVRQINRAEEKEEDYDLDKLVSESREKVEERIRTWLDRIKKMDSESRFNIYLNTISNLQDPHTGYFKPKDKQDFDMRMSNQLEGIGARLTTEGEHVKIVSIVPGGPAWKQGELEPNDLILKVAQEDEEPVDISGWSLDDVVSIIRGPKGTKVTITVRKIDNKVVDIEITRDVVVFEEGYARSAILQKEGKDTRIGYLNLPSFYFNIGNASEGRNSKDDVKAELKKLNEENIDGLIFDLRNNGGGSLNDVVDMSGFFIEEGPVVQVKARASEPQVLSNRENEVVYSGPLVIMVNSFSASASEILAAALQDYGRAIIVGGNSTFGKGTVQRFYNLDRMVRGHNELKPLGELKVTTQKFYRINGGSTQLKGVRPDIVIPDNFHFVTVGENDYDFAMEWSEIQAVDFSQNVWEVDDNLIHWLRKRSEDRISEDELFTKVLANADRLKRMRNHSVRPLGIETYREFLREREEEAEQFRDMFHPIESIHISNIEADLEFIHSDSSRIARNESFFENIQKDAYIFETIQIMNDLLNGSEVK